MTSTPPLRPDPAQPGQTRSPVRGAVIWLTGLPGSGKSTLANGAAETLRAAGYVVRVLDGDALRAGLSSDLGFSRGDRLEQARRVSEVAALFAEIGVICLVALVSPHRESRAQARHRIGETFREVFISASLETCEARDPKGMYGLARRGELTGFTGVSGEYERPSAPELVIDTMTEGPEACIVRLVEFIRSEFPDSLRS